MQVQRPLRGYLHSGLHIAHIPTLRTQELSPRPGQIQTAFDG